MHIMIDIPEAYYEALRKTDVIVSGQRSGKTLLSVIYNAIANGIQLPKGHGDLIDRDMCLKMKCRDLVDADGVTMYAVPTGNILCMKAVIPADKDGD